jgi:hypothetical protein
MMLRVRRWTVGMTFALALAPHTLVACMSAPPSLAPDPRTWSAVRCAACKRTGVSVETRRSIDERGHAGRYVFARVSNHNAYAVTFFLDLVSANPPSGDPDFTRRQVRVTLPPRGETESSALLTLDYSDIAEAHVSGVERL